MHFAFTDEQEQLRATVRALLDARASGPVGPPTADEPAGYDRALWRELADLGVAGMAVPERYGGLGYGFVELAVVLEEAGRALLPSPLLATAVLGTHAFVASGDAQRCAAVLPGVIAGTTLLAVGRHSGPRPTARRGGSGWELTGDCGRVPDAAAADVLVLVADAPDGERTFTVDAGAPGLERRHLPTMDRTIRLADVRCAGTPATPLGHGVVDDTELRAAAAVALLAVGGADRCLATSVTYAGQRIQFDAPIGSFQAIQHRLADMAMDVESARSAAYYAAWCVDADPDRLPRYAALAKSFATEAYAAAAGEQLQVHGGIGFTWEHEAHRHLKRARALLALHGSPAEHRARLWELIAAETAGGAGA